MLLAEVAFEVVELGLGSIAQFDIGELVVGCSLGGGDVFSASVIHRYGSSLLDDVVAPVAVVTEEGGGGEHVFS